MRSILGEGVDSFSSKFIAGAFGGTVGTILNTPFDVVKTRIQNNSLGMTTFGRTPWTISALSHVLREEGVFALYKGFVPKVFRLGPGGGILLVVFDTMINIFTKFELV